MDFPTLTLNSDQILVATAGEALIDMIQRSDGRYEPCIGGAIYNLTRALARQGVPTAYLNPLSKDKFGRLLAEGLAEAGVVMGMPAPVQEVTSLAMVNLDEQGHPDYAFYREGVADRTIQAGQLIDMCDRARQLKVVCTGALALAAADADIYLPWLKNQSKAGHRIVVDANLRPSVMPDLDAYRQNIHRALQYADVIKVSDEDLDHLGVAGTDAQDKANRLLLETNAKFLTLTMGKDGACLLTRFGQTVQAAETESLTVIDTVGAGDCFLAGLVAAVLQAELPDDWGRDQVDSAQARTLVEQAIASASLCVMRRGCQPPTRQEVQARAASAKLLWK